LVGGNIVVLTQMVVALTYSNPSDSSSNFF